MSKLLRCPPLIRRIFFFSLLVVSWFSWFLFFAQDEIISSKVSQTSMVDQRHAQASNKSICFSWEDGEKADFWWTHNPQYHVNVENETGFCFSMFKNETKRNFMQELYENQYHGNCSDVISYSMASSGWGFDFLYLADGLWYGMTQKKPVQMILTGLSQAKPGVWHYAGTKDGSKPVCPTTDMYCYMLNLTKCPSNPQNVMGQNRSFISAPGFESHQEWIVEYETRIQSWLRKEVYDYFTTRIRIQTPCTVFHVRRSDIKGHGLRKYHTIDEFVNKAGQDLHQDVLLLTDDSNAIEEAESISMFTPLNFMYFNRTRFRADEGGWENHFPSGDPKLEVVTLLSIFKAVRHCDSIVVQSGSFAGMLVGQMEDELGKGNVKIANLGS